ncbi:hypothetical protein FOL47_006020 [Perkinsus chesapeaki]|uniref:RNA helicase n=1 Tax=Perkinsus chesapeaki TaxID=330153 RepID=A0A7J6LU99_PERCH|nr:hypothetical protein FOL47_006020 [Perkinsus chesapeaki]
MIAESGKQGHTTATVAKYIPPYKRKELAELALTDGQLVAPHSGTRHLEESFSPQVLKARPAWGHSNSATFARDIGNRDKRRFTSIEDRSQGRFGSSVGSFTERRCSSFSSLSGYGRRKESRGMSNDRLDWTQPVSKGDGTWIRRGGRRAFHEDPRDVFEEDNAMTTGINFDEYDKIPVEVSGRGAAEIGHIECFGEASLNEEVMRNIERCGYSKPTPIQKHSIPVIMAKRDLMACAQTGSGKTGKNTLLESSLAGRDVDGIFILQGIRPVVVYGGAEIRLQLRELERGCDMLVATPGRLTDLIERYRVSLSEVKCLIFDEADRMLDMGFEPQIRRIVEQEDMPSSRQGRQSTMFSATFPKEIQQLARDFLHDYVFLTVGRVGSTHNSIRQVVRYVDDRDKYKDLRRILEDQSEEGLTLAQGHQKGFEGDRLGGSFEAGDSTKLVGVCPYDTSPLSYAPPQLCVPRGVTPTLLWPYSLSETQCNLFGLSRQEKCTLASGFPQALPGKVFVETKRRADELEHMLCRDRYPATSIHGDRSQMEREEALRDFKLGMRPILVATDVAARGLDISHVNHVINYDLPHNIDDYVHRIGRTGRVGNLGTATSFVNENGRPILRDLWAILEENDQEVPSWFMSLLRDTTTSSRGSKFGPGKGRFKGSRSGSFGSRDVRQHSDSADFRRFDSTQSRGLLSPGRLGSMNSRFGRQVPAVRGDARGGDFSAVDESWDDAW